MDRQLWSERLPEVVEAATAHRGVATSDTRTPCAVLERTTRFTTGEAVKGALNNRGRSRIDIPANRFAAKDASVMCGNPMPGRCRSHSEPMDMAPHRKLNASGARRISYYILQVSRPVDVDPVGLALFGSLRVAHFLADAALGTGHHLSLALTRCLKYELPTSCPREASRRGTLCEFFHLFAVVVDNGTVQKAAINGGWWPGRVTQYLNVRAIRTAGRGKSWLRTLYWRR